MWKVIQCSRLECSRYLVVRDGTKTRKCPYCNRVNKVVDTYRMKFATQEEARAYVQKRNLRM